ncbi:YeiH family protein [Nonomuraea sp. LPB2021202275-12-8]|uniref:YeiH family protein n=1 Tax=Nonomuraea sp. LPB2021202275-12-8 TaxID=3120159 RepID=UPI00300CEEC7
MLQTTSRPSLLPGLLVTAAAVALALTVHQLAPMLSPAVVAVVAGAVLAGLGGAGERLLPGLRFVSRRVLRVAIVLLGLQISVPQVLAMGWRTAAVVLVATGATFAITPLIGRQLGLTPGTSLLVATGVSICGAAAIAAMRDSAGGDDEDAANALGVVVLYGSGAIVAVPLLASWLGLSPAQLGVWTGAAVHEVAQVAAIGAATGVLAAAVTVKLGRVILLAPIVALTARTRHGDERPPIMPLFVAGFLAMVALRSTGIVPPLVTQAVPPVTNLLMAAALFGLGTGIDVRRLLGGGRAMLLGGIATALVGGISLVCVMILVPA